MMCQTEPEPYHYYHLCSGPTLDVTSLQYQSTALGSEQVQRQVFNIRLPHHHPSQLTSVCLPNSPLPRLYHKIRYYCVQFDV